MHEGARVLGSIIAPDDRVHLHKNVSFQGAICAKEIDIDMDSTVLHHDSSSILPSAPRLAQVPDVQVDVRSQQMEITTVPEKFELSQNYPNPFNPETWIPYRLAKAADVTLTIYNLQGAVVRTIDLGHQPAAVYDSRDRAIYFDGRNDAGDPVVSSIYFYHLQAGEYQATKKMLIVK